MTEEELRRLEEHLARKMQERTYHEWDETLRGASRYSSSTTTNSVGPGARLRTAREALDAAEAFLRTRNEPDLTAVQRAEKRIAELKQQNHRWRAQADEYRLRMVRAEIGRDRLRAEVMALKARAGSGAGPDTEMVRRLLQLCHPDKHNNSQASQRATAWLMEQKR